MDLITSMEISASALSAQRTRLNVISQNLANAGTTRTPDGGPYRRQVTVFKAAPFASHLEQSLDKPAGAAGEAASQGVSVEGVYNDTSPFRRVYDPSHPDADDDGFVMMPNVDVVTEMVNLVNATRSYEANVTAVNSSKKMALKALEIAR